MAVGDVIVFYDTVGKDANDNVGVDFAKDLPAGASLSTSGHTILHTPAPGGVAQSPTIVKSGTRLVFQTADFDVTGWHRFKLRAAYQDTTPGNLKKTVYVFLRVIDPTAPPN